MSKSVFVLFTLLLFLLSFQTGRLYKLQNSTKITPMAQRCFDVGGFVYNNKTDICTKAGKQAENFSRTTTEEFGHDMLVIGSSTQHISDPTLRFTEFEFHQYIDFRPSEKMCTDFSGICPHYRIMDEKYNLVKDLTEAEFYTLLRKFK